ncbi:hypothetical protein HZS55_01000 [Halosimplex rubrum]|uniref:Uncharacterized protein n=1 Tax=Halosimplex rubrum TaxID=869889 RepID=A0A7D5SNS8_9EURY|nr:hypothetical protein [Halosimplex rubrum]QLH75967.1 hypothetical protein HZS55_01000 [Halosimplex rubrum]
MSTERNEDGKRNSRILLAIYVVLCGELLFGDGWPVVYSLLVLSVSLVILVTAYFD